MLKAEDVYEALSQYLAAAAEAAAAPIQDSARLRALVEQRRLEYQNILEACMLELVPLGGDEDPHPAVAMAPDHARSNDRLD